VWSPDGQTVFYTKVNAQLRPWQVCAHTIGHTDSVQSDAVIFQDLNQEFFVDVNVTKDKVRLLRQRTIDLRNSAM
jgi:protease II